MARTLRGVEYFAIVIRAPHSGARVGAFLGCNH